MVSVRAEKLDDADDENTLKLWIFFKFPTRFVHLSAFCCHQAFLRDLEWGRRQQPSFWKRLHFRRVEMGVRKTLQILEKDCPPPSSDNRKL